MHKLTLITAISLVALTAACGDETAPPNNTSATATSGAGGDAGAGAGAGGSGATSDTTSSTASGMGGQGAGDVVVDEAVGAAYANKGDARIVLVDATGTRTALYNPSTGTFESPDDIDELEGGTPLGDVAAAANVGNMIYMFDQAGQVTIYDRDQATFSPAEALPDALDDVPFNNVGAAFGSGDTLFIFNAGGTSYAAYNTADETWSQIYDFASEFGNGGAPIANVGAAYSDGNSFVLFDLSGTKYAIYSGSGQFSDDFDLDELGDGNLTFND